MGIEKIKEAVDQIISRVPAVKGRGEEATKQAMVLPMLHAMGYDIWNPAEVCPEYEADFSIKKSGQKEKVDIAILAADGRPVIYVEVKSVDTGLDGHEGQLARYFNSTSSVVLGLLTNGVEWRLFTDTAEPNRIDAQPFHICRLDNLDQGLDVLARFCKCSFNAEAVREHATELKYTAKIASFMRHHLDLKEREPDEELIRWILRGEDMYPGIVNANVVARFRPIVKTAMTRVIRDIVRRSVTALDEEVTRPDSILTDNSSVAQPSPSDEDTPPEDIASGRLRAITTTEDEIALYEAIKTMFLGSPLATASILDHQGKMVPAAIGYKDTTAYLGIFLNRPSYWCIRAILEGRTKWIGFNIPPEQGKNLTPPEVTILPPTAHAEFRVQVHSWRDVEMVNDLVLAALRSTIQSRTPDSTTPPQPPEMALPSQSSMPSTSSSTSPE